MHIPRLATLAALTALLACAHTHAFDVTVTTAPTSGGAWAGNTFTPTAPGATVNAGEVQTRLAGGAVTVQSTGGDALAVRAPIAWAANVLTLAAGGSLAVQAQLDATGAAGLALHYGQGAVAAGNTADYLVSAPVNLAATGSYQTRLGSDGAVRSYTILTTLGVEGSTTGADLQGMNGDWARNYALGADIDASATAGWAGGFGPIAPSTTRIDGFTGRFDGLGHVIDRLTIDRPSNNYVGLFGNSRDGALVNVGLTRASVAGGVSVGILAGGTNTMTVRNVYTTGSVTGVNAVGGVAGDSFVDLMLDGVWSKASVTATQMGAGTGAPSLGGIAGGLVGGSVSRGPTIVRSYALGAFSGSDFVGGLLGHTGQRPEIHDSYFAGTLASNKATPLGLGAIAGRTQLGNVGNVTWNSDSAGAAGIGENTGNSTSVVATTPLTLAQMRNAANYPPLFTFTTTPGAGTDSGWVLLGSNGGLNNASGTVLPLRSSEWAASVGSAHQLQLMALKPDAAYTLARDVDAAPTAGAVNDVWQGSSFMPVGKGTAFSGSFDGLGRTISQLAIARPGALNVGLFSQTSGAALSNVGLLGSTVEGGTSVGALLGLGSATITHAYVGGGTVVGGSGVGGLAGVLLGGSVVESYAHAAVSNSTGGNATGGLVGSAANALIADSYASGSVAGFFHTGGLAGSLMNNAVVARSYATGAVSGPSFLRGLVGDVNTGASVVSSFWDTQTTGQGTSAGGAGAVGRTTAQMQQLATFTAAGWAIDDAGGTGTSWRIYEGHTAPLLRHFFTAPLTATAASGSKPFDGTAATSLAVTYTPVAPDARLLGTASVVADDTAPGTHTARVTGIYSAQHGYDIARVAGTITITPLAPVTAAITASAGTGGTLACTPNPAPLGAPTACTAAPSAGYTTQSISGCGGTATGAGANSYTTGNITGACTVTAQFALNHYAITVTPGAGGSATCTPNPVPHGASATCTAVADDSYQFTGWSGACTGSACTLANVQSPQAVAAQFARVAPVPTPVPTLSPWGLLLLAMGLSLFGLQRLPIKRWQL